MRLRTRASLEMVREWIDTRADVNWRRRDDDLVRFRSGIKSGTSKSTI